MRDIDPDLIDLFRERRGVTVHLLLWIVGRDRTTGAAVPLGFTSADEDLTVTIGGSARTYAADGRLGADPIVAETGLSVRMQTVRLSGVAAEVEAALRGADPRLAPAELHRIVLDPATGAIVGGVQLLFRGTVDAAPIRTPEKGGTVTVSLTLASAAREMTRTLTLKWSDESQQRRGGDRFLRYADVSGEVDVWWGGQRLVPRIAPPQPPGVGSRPNPQPPDGSGWQ
ncbi:MAG: hypothetical protein ACT4OK_01130 [Gemmobacter sp.]